VLTSGATVEGCAGEFLRAAVANVHVLIFARVADPIQKSI
jgi:predicted amidophosphoribosyltransferase